MLHRIETRSFEECEMIVRLWLEGSREEVIEVLGGEPTSDFLSSFQPTAPALPAPEVVEETTTKRKSYTRKSKATD